MNLSIIAISRNKFILFKHFSVFTHSFLLFLQLVFNHHLTKMNTLAKKPWWKIFAPYAAAIVLFILLAVIYASPVLDGKVVNAEDTKSWEGMYQESKTFHENTGEYTWWSGSMFCGMPTYQIGGGKYQGSNLGAPISMLVRLGFSGTLAILICYFLGFYILMRAFKVNAWLSIIGSIAITFSSYFFIIIGAGHVVKAFGLGLMAPVIGGFYLIFQKKYGWGIIITMIYTAIGFMSHPQMSYYIFMLIGVLFFAELYTHIKEKRMLDLGKGILLFAVAVVIGLGTGYAKYKTNTEYLKETMRGGHSDLVNTAPEKGDAASKAGLDIKYATQWSYGIDETLTFLIPGYKGNSSNYDVGKDSETYKALINNGVPRKEAESFSKHVPAYWGNQPSTSGPVYMGAIVCFLFLLGLIIVKGPYKWALLVATLFSILLSLGSNFMSLTELFFNYFPMYNKFRAVSSILIVAEITMPLLGFLAIKAIMNQEVTKKKALIGVFISGGITMGICLFIALFGPMMFDFTSSNDSVMFSQLPEWLSSAILADRASILRTDALRSFLFILLGGGLVWLYASARIKAKWFIPLLGILVLSDMWPINKRFFNDDYFVTAKQDKNYFKKMPYEEQLLNSDKDPNYRVLNLTTNTFNESRTSYYFKSIGGYHAAKLRRYQDLIEAHISKNNMEVINMLNTKYLFVPGENGDVEVKRNPDAMGNAWFVDSLFVVNTPNEESDALNTINLRNSAVTDVKFKSFAQNFKPGHDSTATVQLLSYAPNKLEYKYSASCPGTIVFSEIYYPYGWKAFIDDKPVEHFRANYTLRALNVPAGQHQIRFVFDPDSAKNGSIVSIICFLLIYATIAGIAIYEFFRYRKNRKNVVKQ